MTNEWELQQPNPNFKHVRAMHVQCSLRVRNFDAPGIAMSDCCGASAVSAVKFPDGREMWRCKEHEGVRSIETGPVVYFVQVNETV